MRNIKTKRRFVIMTMVVSLSIPAVAFTQGGMFQRGESGKEIQDAILQRSGGEGVTVTNQTFGHPIEGVDVTNQTFGAPLGNGIIALLAASAGYAALKSNKRNKKSRKENK